jgi:RecA-family ATPase
MALSYRSSGPPTKSGLPLSVESYLRSGAAEGGRNHAVFAAAAQLRDMGLPQDEAANHLVPRATQDGLSASEAVATIESAYRGEKREAPVGKSGSSYSGGSGGGGSGSLPERPHKGVYRIKSRSSGGGGFDRRDGGYGSGGENQASGSAWARATSVPLPDRMEDGFEELLRAAFEEGEGVCIGGTFCNDEGEHKPDVGVTLTREQWIDRVRQKGGDFSRMHTSKNGHFIRVNPMRISPDSRNGDADVAKFRHVLVEFDTDARGQAIKKDRQFGAILASGLPVTAVLDSGNKSIHAWVRVEAANAEEYKERAAEVYELFGEDLDAKNHNPSRYSRCPDGIRTVGEKGEEQQVRQSLLKVGVGAKSWVEWKRTSAAQALGEPWRPLRDFENYNIENDPNTVIGNRWLCKGGSLVIVSQSGVGKSSMQMQLKVGWSIGRDDMTFGIKPVRPLKQLTLQAENDQGDVAEAWRDITQAYKLSMVEKAAADENCLWHRVTTLVAEEFLEVVEALVQLHQPDVCWIDPLLNYIGDDVSKAEVISHFCVEGLSAISLKTGVIFVLIHHAGKPKDQRTRDGMNSSDLAYLGLGSSALTNWAREVLVLSRVKTASADDPATFTLTATKRRTRAGMKSMPVDGDPLEFKPTAEIFVRHSSDGTIRWEQCAEPEKPKGGRPKGAAKQESDDGPKRGPGRACSLSAAQKREIVETAVAHGGKIPMGPRKELGLKFSKDPVTIANYLKRVERDAALMGGSVQDALEADLTGSFPADPPKETRLPYKD